MEENIDNTEEKKPSTKVRDNILVIIFGGIFLIFFWGRIYYKHHTLKVQGKITKGFVYKVVWTRGASLLYRFTVNDTLYIGASDVEVKSHAILGDSITIVYDPEDPDNSDPACDILDSFADIK